MKEPSYLIIGNGKAAKHFARYLKLLSIPFKKWSRQSKTPLEKAAANCNTVIALVSDGAIENFVKNPALKGKKIVHFSGALSVKGAAAIHPLISFSRVPMTLAEYKQIVFVCEKGKCGFGEIFPRLKNSYFNIEPKLKPYYHALCVLSGNLTTIVWRKLFRELRGLGIPERAAEPYLNSIVKNLTQNPNDALTGPFVRKDKKTINANKRALKNDRFYALYNAIEGVL